MPADGEPQAVAHIVDQVALLREEAVVCIAADPEGGAVCRDGQRHRLTDKDIAVEVHRIVLQIGTVGRHRCVCRILEGGGQVGERLGCRRVCEPQRGQGILVEVVAVGSYDECVELASRLLVCGGEYLPYLVVHGAAGKGTLCADTCSLRIAVREEVLRGEDIRMLTCRGFLPIGGKYGEKVVVEGVPLRTRQQIAEEFAGACVVLPEYIELVRHTVSFPCTAIALSLAHKQFPVV